MITILDWLHENMVKLREAGVDSPRRDCMVFLEDFLDKDRSWVIAHPEHKLKPRQITSLDKLISRRAKREPLAYIRRRAWFYKRFFAVSPAVMIPRPESETFIDLLKKLKPETIIDIGTGSGCLAITAKLELPSSNVIATDIDEKALKIARKNAKNHKADIKFIYGSLLEPVYNQKPSPSLEPSSNLKPNTYNLALVVNLPYVPDGFVSSPEVSHEPSSALFSGKDGLDHYRRFFKQVKNYPLGAKHILVESLEEQHEDIAKLAGAAGYKLKRTNDLIQTYVKDQA